MLVKNGRLVVPVPLSVGGLILSIVTTVTVAPKAVSAKLYVIVKALVPAHLTGNAVSTRWWC